ncbi:MAG: 23S rRNA (adenine(2503)-C(2))-methyltransferase RlmN, partial [Rhodanobacteraceae bacterium]
MNQTASTSSSKTNLLDFDRRGLRKFFSALDEKPYRADQVMKWIYHHHVTDFALMTDVGKALRAKLDAVADVVPPRVQLEKQSVDGTHKWLLGMDAGNAIETVF